MRMQLVASAQALRSPQVPACRLFSDMSCVILGAQVRANFRPEFVNRVDEFVVFEALKKDEIKHIVRLQVRVHNSLVSLGTLVRLEGAWRSDISVGPQMRSCSLPYTKPFAQLYICNPALVDLSGVVSMAIWPR